MAKNEKDFNFLINDEIRLNDKDEVRLVVDDESNVVLYKDVKNTANENGFDIIGINLKATPPVLTVGDYNKFRYDFKKSRKPNKQKPLKEIDLRVNIAPNDLSTKVNHAKEFITHGSKVKVVLTVKGRELSRFEQSSKPIYDFIDMISDVAIPENLPKRDGNKFIVILKKK